MPNVTLDCGVTRYSSTKHTAHLGHGMTTVNGLKHLLGCDHIIRLNSTELALDVVVTHLAS